MASGILYGSDWEGGQVFAWKLKPNKYAIENSGAHFGVVISFETNAQFISDATSFHDINVIKYLPVKAKGPILVWNVKIVG